MKRSILISSVLIAGLSLAAVGTYAASGMTTTTGTVGMSMSKMARGEGFGHKMGGPGGMRALADMTDAEKTAFESMSNAEKKTFMEKKFAEMQVQRDAREAVIDKLLAGTALTADEETLRQTIITDRAAHKVKEAQMKAKMEQIQAILAKKQAGTTLTTDEQALLQSMPKMGKKHGGHRGDDTDRDRETDDDTVKIQAQ